MKKQVKLQLEKNIGFCIDQCDMDDDQIGEMLRCIERMGIASVEHFCEEFVFVAIDEDGEDYVCDDWHNDEYLNIAEFNAMYWEGN